MDRRKVLLIVAAVVAALGTLLVFLYVRSADNRADQRYGAVQVLKVVKPIASGTTVQAAQAAGSFQLSPVSRQDVLPGALTALDTITAKVAIVPLSQGEQVIASKFGDSSSGAAALSIPKGKLAITISLGDTAKVAGFVTAGSNVAIFSGNKVLLASVPVLAVGSTTTAAAATTAAGGAAPAPAASPLFTLALSQADAEKVLGAASSLSFAAITADSQVVADR